METHNPIIIFITNSVAMKTFDLEMCIVHDYFKLLLNFKKFSHLLTNLLGAIMRQRGQPTFNSPKYRIETNLHFLCLIIRNCF